MPNSFPRDRRSTNARALRVLYTYAAMGAPLLRSAQRQRVPTAVTLHANKTQAGQPYRERLRAHPKVAGKASNRSIVKHVDRLKAYEILHDPLRHQELGCKLVCGDLLGIIARCRMLIAEEYRGGIDKDPRSLAVEQIVPDLMGDRKALPVRMVVFIHPNDCRRVFDHQHPRDRILQLLHANRDIQPASDLLDIDGHAIGTFGQNLPRCFLWLLA